MQQPGGAPVPVLEHNTIPKMMYFRDDIDPQCVSLHSLRCKKKKKQRLKPIWFKPKGFY